MKIIYSKKVETIEKDNSKSISYQKVDEKDADYIEYNYHDEAREMGQSRPCKRVRVK